jgi:predicted nucleic acid-binding protein
VIYMIIVDTNVIIDIERGKKSLKTLLERFENENFCVSAISVLELYVGLGYSKKKKGDKFFKVQKGLINTILADFEIIPVTLPILKKAGLKKGMLMALGMNLDFEDIIIGITGEELKVVQILTRNKKHFDSFSISICDY